MLIWATSASLCQHNTDFLFLSETLKLLLWEFPVTLWWLQTPETTQSWSYWTRPLHLTPLITLYWLICYIWDGVFRVCPPNFHLFRTAERQQCDVQCVKPVLRSCSGFCCRPRPLLVVLDASRSAVLKMFHHIYADDIQLYCCLTL